MIDIVCKLKGAAFRFAGTRLLSGKNRRFSAFFRKFS